uniref:Uncharacterized protein n=1 Tax=Cannabis sativa TaxID=3483 RepID=A0A803PLY8_CANSA
MDQIATIISLLQKQPSTPTQPLELTQPSHYGDNFDEDDMYPEDWEPNIDEVPSTPTDAIMVTVGDTQSQDVQELDGPPPGVEFLRVRRKWKPIFLKDNTEGKKKQQIGPVEVDTLRRTSADSRLYKFFQKWITYSRDNGVLGMFTLAQPISLSL